MKATAAINFHLLSINISDIFESVKQNANLVTKHANESGYQ
jgi:hypothetical protein